MLRDTLADRTQRALTPALAATALRQGNRMRARRRVAAGCAVTALVLAASAVGYAVVPDHDPSRKPVLPATSVSPAPRPTPSAPPLDPPAVLPASGPVLIQGVAVLAYTSPTGDRMVYDRAHHRYTKVAAVDVQPAPAGSLVGYRTSNDEQYTLRDLASGRTASVDGRMSGPRGLSWSADGKRLAVFNGFGETSTLLVQDVPGGHVDNLGKTDFGCNDYCFATWLPDGTEVALALTDRSVGHEEAQRDRQRGLQLFSAADGKPTRLLPMPGAVFGPQSWSPDGRYAVIEGTVTRDGKRVRQTQIVETATGTIRGHLDGPAPDVVWAGPELLAVPAGATVDLYTPNGYPVRRVPLPAALVGTGVTLGRP
jgi:hypothetical protein